MLSTQNLDSKYHSGLNGSRDSWRSGRLNDPSREKNDMSLEHLVSESKEGPPVRRRFKKIQKVKGFPPIKSGII